MHGNATWYGPMHPPNHLVNTHMSGLLNEHQHGYVWFGHGSDLGALDVVILVVLLVCITLVLAMHLVKVEVVLGATIISTQRRVGHAWLVVRWRRVSHPNKASSQ